MSVSFPTDVWMRVMGGEGSFPASHLDGAGASVPCDRRAVSRTSWADRSRSQVGRLVWAQASPSRVAILTRSITSVFARALPLWMEKAWDAPLSSCACACVWVGVGVDLSSPGSSFLGAMAPRCVSLASAGFERASSSLVLRTCSRSNPIRSGRVPWRSSSAHLPSRRSRARSLSVPRRQPGAFPSLPFVVRVLRGRDVPAPIRPSSLHRLRSASASARRRHVARAPFVPVRNGATRKGRFAAQASRMAMKDARAWVSERRKGRETRVRFERAFTPRSCVSFLPVFVALAVGIVRLGTWRSITCSDPPRARISAMDDGAIRFHRSCCCGFSGRGRRR